MRCIFCKQDSSSSRSVEHIVPESLGNTEHVLPVGVVCDKCNNYIAREIEKPLLDSAYFRQRRFYSGLPNKKKRIPTIRGMHVQSLTPVELMKVLGEDGISVGGAPEVDESRWVESIRARESGTFVFPVGEMPSNFLLSRFLGKVGLEVLAHRVLDVAGGIDSVVDHPQLDELREYVRIGNPRKDWRYSYRRLYPRDLMFSSGTESYELLHEFDILVTPATEYYIVLAMFGEEFALNLGGPEIDGYQAWLAKNDDVSPLYGGRNVGRI